MSEEVVLSAHACARHGHPTKQYVGRPPTCNPAPFCRVSPQFAHCFAGRAPCTFPRLSVAATAAWHAVRPWPPSVVLFCVADYRTLPFEACFPPTGANRRATLRPSMVTAQNKPVVACFTSLWSVLCSSRACGGRDACRSAPPAGNSAVVLCCRCCVPAVYPCKPVAYFCVCLRNLHQVRGAAQRQRRSTPPRLLPAPTRART